MPAQVLAGLRHNRLMWRWYMPTTWQTKSLSGLEPCGLCLLGGRFRASELVIPLHLPYLHLKVLCY